MQLSEWETQDSCSLWNPETTWCDCFDNAIGRYYDWLFAQEILDWYQLWNYSLPFLIWWFNFCEWIQRLEWEFILDPNFSYIDGVLTWAIVGRSNWEWFPDIEYNFELTKIWDWFVLTKSAISYMENWFFSLSSNGLKWSIQIPWNHFLSILSEAIPALEFILINQKVRLFAFDGCIFNDSNGEELRYKWKYIYFIPYASSGSRKVFKINWKHYAMIEKGWKWSLYELNNWSLRWQRDNELYRALINIIETQEFNIMPYTPDGRKNCLIIM